MYHFQAYYTNWMMPWGFLPFVVGGFLFSLLVLWSLVWKGIALWHAARAGHKGWFIALLVLNTAGILDILYIYVFSKKSRQIDMK